AARKAPNREGAAGPAGDNRPPAAREGETGALAGMTRERLSALPSRGVAEMDPARRATRGALPAGSEQLAVGREGDTVERPLDLDALDLLAGAGFPQRQAAVVAGSREHLAIGRQGRRGDRSAVPPRTGHLFARGSIPQSDGAALASRREELAVRRERD